jgi:hypothetical protein
MICGSDRPHYLLVFHAEIRRQVCGKEKSACTTMLFIRFKNTHSDCSSEFIPTEQIIMKEAKRCLAVPKTA